MQGIESKENTVDLMNKSDINFSNTQKLSIFWVGFVMYSLGFTIANTADPNYLLCDVLSLIGICLFIPAALPMIQFRFENRYLKALFCLYILWLLIVVFRGFNFNYEFLKNTLFNPYSGIFIYFVPIALILAKPPLFYKVVFNVILILGLAYAFHIVFSWNILLDPDNPDARDIFEIPVKSLALPSGFLLLTYNYHSTKRQIIALAIIVFTLLLAIYMARRGLMFMMSSILIFMFLIFLSLKKDKLGSLFLFAFIGLFLIGFVFTFLDPGKIPFLDRAKERLDEDTRSGVEDYYYADMEFKDWLVGRGMSGLVAAPYALTEDTPHLGYREGIETDYLNIILKGGLISLGLLLLIAIPAMIKGLFYSENSLSKASGFWILLWLISLYPSTVTTFTLNYILVWIAIGICYSKTIRDIPEEVLKAYFQNQRELTDTYKTLDQ